jgi:RNA polymerase-binding transcription factor DksA
MVKKTDKKNATKKTTAKTSLPKSTKKSAANKKEDTPKTNSKKQKKTNSQKAVKIKAAKEVEVISPTKKIKKIKGYSKKDLEVFKKVILEKRKEIVNQIQNLKDQMMDPTTGQYVNENSPYSLHMAEQGTDAQEREKLYLWAQRETKFLGYLEDALQRIENGVYGICIECIDEPKYLCPTCPLVPKERLLAVPHTQHCLQVKQLMQKKK